MLKPGTESETLGLVDRGVVRRSSLLLSSLELSDTQVYEPQIRALLGTASHFYEVVVFKVRTVPIGTALSLRTLRVIFRGAQAMYKPRSQMLGSD